MRVCKLDTFVNPFSFCLANIHPVRSYIHILIINYILSIVNKVNVKMDVNSNSFFCVYENKHILILKQKRISRVLTLDVEYFIKNSYK